MFWTRFLPFVVVELLLSGVAMVNIPINNEDPMISVIILSIDHSSLSPWDVVVVNGNLGCYGNAVKDAESHAFLSDGMMARGPYNRHSRRQLDEKGGFVYTLGEVCCTYKIKPLTLYKKDTSIEDASFCHIQLQYLQMRDSCWNCPIFKAGPTFPCRTFSVISITLPAARRAQGKISCGGVNTDRS